MERSRRVYPSQRSKDGWLSGLMLFLSAVVVLSGLVFRGEENTLLIERAATPTPIPLEEKFDETPAQKELDLPEATWYALQLGVFENEEAAHALGEDYARRGAAGYVWPDGRYRTLAAVYPSKEDAQAVREQLRQTHEVETYLYEIDLPSIRLRLSGMQGQLEILEAAFLHAADLVAELQNAGMALDRQEKGAAETLEILTGLNQQLMTVSLRLRQRFLSPRPAVVDGLLACFEDYAAFVQTIAQAQTEVELGRRLKYQTLSSLHQLQEVYDTVSNT